MVAWAAWAWILGLVGLGVAVSLRWLSGRRVVAGAEPGVGMGALGGRTSLFFAIFVIVVGVLLGLATTIVTGVAFLSGAVCAGLAVAFALAVRARGARPVAGSGLEDDDLGDAFVAGSALALAVASLALLGLGIWYAVRGAHAITDSDYANLAALCAGFAFGAGCAALYVRILGAVAVGVSAAVAAPESTPTKPGARSLAEVAGTALAGVAGAGADVLTSLAGALVAAMALGAGVPQYASSRQAAAALPVLLLATGVIGALVAVGVARAFGRGEGEWRLRNVVLIATFVFLVLVYVVVRGLGFQIVDPTGVRLFRPDAPFWAVVIGAVAALLIGITNRIAAGRARRLAEATGFPGWRALPLAGALAPAVVIALAVWGSYYLAGLYCVGIAAAGMAITTCIALALGALAPMLGGVPAGEGQVAPEAGARVERWFLVDDTTATGRGMIVGSAAFSGLALLGAYASLIGLPEGTLDLLEPPVLFGLMIGVAVPFAFDGSILGTIRRGRAAALRANPGLARGRGGAPGGAVRIGSRTVLVGTIVPGLLAIVLPAAAALLSPTLIGGLLGGTILVAFVLAAATILAEGPLAATAPTLNTLATVMALATLALTPLIAAFHSAAASAALLHQGVRPLLALLGG